MIYQKFIDSLDETTCPAGLEPCLQALWFDARNDWHTAHEIVQDLHDTMAARIHAYLHRKEGDKWNSRYWHRVAGTAYPHGLDLNEEWEQLVRELVD